LLEGRPRGNRELTSSARRPSRAHVLEVLLLAREAQLFRPREESAGLNIVPCSKPWRRCNRRPDYQAPADDAGLPAHLRCAGYPGSDDWLSDSNKEWVSFNRHGACYQAQRALGETSRRMGITVQIFHGRGGAVVAERSRQPVDSGAASWHGRRPAAVYEQGEMDRRPVWQRRNRRTATSTRLPTRALQQLCPRDAQPRPNGSGC